MFGGWTFDEALPIVGRDKVIDDTASALLAGQSVILRGPAGVGKSRILREVSRRLEQHQQLRLLANETSGAIPLGAFLSVVPREARSGKVLAAVAASTRHAVLDSGLQLLVVDDAHWLDAASAGLLLELARADVPVLASVRSGARLHDAVVALSRNGLAVIVDLPPLSESDTDDLVRVQLGGHVDAGLRLEVFTRSKGNPLLAREVIRHAFAAGCLAGTSEGWFAANPIPEVGGLDDVIGLRLNSLRPEVRRVVDLVALSEPVLETHVRALTSDDAMDAAESAGLITTELSPEGRLVRSAHPLLHDAAIVKMTSLRRDRFLSDLISKVGDDLSNEHIDQRVFIQLGRWRLDRGEKLEPDVLLTLAEAVHTTDPRLCDRFVDAAHRAGGGTVVRMRLANLLAHQHRVEGALAVLADLDDGSLPDEVRLSVTLMRSFLLGLAANRPAEALGLIQQAEREFGRLPQVTAHRALALWLLARMDEAVREARRPFEDPTAPPAIRVHAGLTLRGAHTYSGDRSEFGRIGDEILPLISAASSELPEGAQSLDLGGMLFSVLRDEVDAVIPLGQREYRRALERGDDAVRAQYAHLLGWARCLAGQVRPGLDLVRESTHARGIWARSTAPMVLSHFAHALAIAGRLAEARRVVLRLESTQKSPLHGPHVQVAQLGLLVAEQREAEAREFGFAAAREALARGYKIFADQILYQLVRIGDRQAALEYSRLTPRPLTPPEKAKAAHSAALLAQDASAIEASAGLLASCQLRWYAIEANLQALDGYRSEGRRGDASRVLLMVDRLRRECPGLAVPALARAQLRPRLTPRETQIAQLAAEGCSDRVIASVIGISVRTVTTHLSRVYGKTGVTGRRALDTLFAP